MSAKLNIIIYWISQDFQKNFDLYYKEYNFYNIKINVYCKKNFTNTISMSIIYTITTFFIKLNS